MQQHSPHFFFTRLLVGGTSAFRPTANTVGPWHPALQHGGPPSALLAHAVTQAAASTPLTFVARVTFSFLKPIPVDCVLTATVAPIRVGQKAAHWTASLFAAQDPGSLPAAAAEVMRATAISIKPAPLKGVAAPHENPLRKMPPPDSCSPLEGIYPSPTTHRFRYMETHEVRIAAGVFGKGAADVWGRVRAHFALIDTEPILPLERVALWADSTGGMSPRLDMSEASYVNADMTINLVRPLHGEWCGLRARTELDMDYGSGLAMAHIFDTDGFVGCVSQQQILEVAQRPKL